VLETDVECWARRSVWPLLRQLQSSVNSPTQSSSQESQEDSLKEEEEDEAKQAAALQDWGGLQGSTSSVRDPHVAASNYAFGDFRLVPEGRMH